MGWLAEMRRVKLSHGCLGAGLAALGRPGYLTIDHGGAIGTDRSVEALRERWPRGLRRRMGGWDPMVRRRPFLRPSRAVPVRLVDQPWHSA